MASNKNLQSKNKTLQSLDLYANNLLNVSKIIGNEHSTRSYELEIATRDNTYTGDLILRGGIQTIPNQSEIARVPESGSVRIFAGTVDKPEPDSSGITVKPTNEILLTSSALARNQADGSQIIPGTIKLQAGSTNGTQASNYIKLSTTNNALDIDNSNMVINSDTQMTLKTEGNFSDPLSTGLTLTRSNETVNIIGGVITENARTAISHTSSGTYQVTVPKTSNGQYDTTMVITADNGSSNTFSLHTPRAAWTYDSTVTETSPTETHLNSSQFIVKLPNANSPTTTFDLVPGQASLNTTTASITTAGNYTINTSGNIQQTLSPAADHTFTITATKSGANVPANTLVFAQATSSLTATNAKTVLNTAELLADATTRAVITTPDLTIRTNATPASSSFTLTADAADSTLKVNTLNVNKAINFGQSATPIDSPLGAAAIPVKGYSTELFLDIDTAAVIKSTVNNSNFKVGFPVSMGSNAAGQALLEVSHTAVTNRAYINNLDIKGNIRIGSVTTGSAQANANSGDVTFSDYPSDSAAPVRASGQTIQINSKSIDLDLTNPASGAIALDIDTIGSITLDSSSKIAIGETNSSEVSIDATKLTITGDGTTANTGENLVIESRSEKSGGKAVNTQSFIKSDVMQVKSSFYGNNVHMYWDTVTGSLVFAYVNA